MSEFKDAEDGYRAVIEKHYSGEMIRIYVSDGEEEGIACHLDPADAPAIALAVLEAAGVDSGGSDWRSDAQWAVYYLTQAIKEDEAKAAAAAEEAARGKRRYELAGELYGNPEVTGHVSKGCPMWLAIEKIMDTQDELAKERAK